MVLCNNCEQPITKAEYSGKQQHLCNFCKSLLERTQQIRMSPMEEDDLELVLAWRSNPQIYQNSREQDGPLKWKDHVSWYESRESERHDFMIYYDSRRVGVVSITQTNKISIYLGDFSAHGKGIATAALKWICDRFEHRTPLIAEIHEQNTASVRLFEGCGFQQYARDREWIEYRYEP